MRAIVAVVAVLLCCVAEAQRPAKSVDYDAAARKYLKENTNDPSKFSIVSVAKPVSLSGARVWSNGPEDVKFLDTAYWQPVGKPGAAVRVKYRSANGIGAIVLADRVLLIDEAGEVFRQLSPDDIRYQGQQGAKSDPITDGFLKQFQP